MTVLKTLSVLDLGSRAASIIDGYQTAVLSDRSVCSKDAEFFFGNGHQVVGRLKLSKGEKVNLWDCASAVEKHGLTEEQINKLWPGVEQLHIHQVSDVERVP